jgi:hypothetical protein
MVENTLPMYKTVIEIPISRRFKTINDFRLRYISIREEVVEKTERYCDTKDRDMFEDTLC